MENRVVKQIQSLEVLLEINDKDLFKGLSAYKPGTQLGKNPEESQRRKKS